VTTHALHVPQARGRRGDGDEDLHDVIRLMRMNYDRVVGVHGLP
jgi:hypothetical protein